MKSKRTGINEPQIAVELLREKGVAEIRQWSDPPGREYRWHAHAGYELRWVMFGELELETEEGTFTLLGGDLAVLEPGEKHRARTGSQGAGYVSCLVDPDFTLR